MLSYRTRYGYPWRWAVLAEIAWRIEHIGYYRGGNGGLCGVVRTWAYAKRKAYERKGSR